MTSYNLNIKSKKRAETIMKTTINLYGKGIEVVSWCMFLDVWLSQDQRHAQMASKRTFIINVANFCLCMWSIKEVCKWGYDCTIKLSKGETW